MTCRLTTNSRKDCIGTDSDMNSDDPGVSTDPLENGYVVGGLSKGDICFLRGIDIDNVKAYEFPAERNAESPDPHLIMHHPNEIWGYEDEKLMELYRPIIIMMAFHLSGFATTKRCVLLTGAFWW